MIPASVLPVAFLFHAVALSVFATICSIKMAKPRTFALGSVAVFAGVYLVTSLVTWNRIRSAREMYPVESLADRLAYEDRHYDSMGLKRPTLGVSESQDQRRSTYSLGPRERALRDVHADALRMFIDAPGFGVARMMGDRPGRIEFISFGEKERQSPPLPIPEAVPSGFSRPVSEEDRILSSTPLSSPEEQRSFHAKNTQDFLDGFGYARDRTYVVGFVDHRLTKVPIYPFGAMGIWRIDALDLISILKHKEPVAYVSKHLPRMDELREAPTRPLDEFEAERLPKLQAGGELSAAQGPRRIRMLGAIRAQEVCLNCHTANKDDLLGAFSYDLRLDLPAPANR
jgi:hypothetical protein